MGTRFRCRVSPTGVPGCGGTGGGTGGGEGPPGPEGPEGPVGPAGPEGSPPELTEVFSGTAVISTVQYSLTNDSTTIAENTEPGLYWLWVDVSDLEAGDVYEFFVLEEVVSGGPQQSLSIAIGADVDPTPIICGPFALINGWDFTAIRTAGVNRSISWSIRRE